MEYSLMHKNINVLDFDLNDNGTINRITKINNEAHMPFGTNSFSDSVNRIYLKEWWNDRKIPLSRDEYKAFLERINKKDSSTLLILGQALSLNDQYWIKKKEDNVDYEDINYFSNKFSNDIGDILVNKKINKMNIDYNSPDSTSVGNLKKRWKLVNGNVALLKAGTKPYQYEIFSELIASKVMEILDINHVSYYFVIDDNNIYSASNNFINYNEDFVSAYMLSKSEKKENNVSLYNHLMKVYDKLNIPNYKAEINKMLFVDYLVGNTDRHLNNFGVIRNSKTLEFLRVAPIYDTGSSLGFDLTDLELENVNNIKWKPFKSNNVKTQLDLIDDYSWLNINKLSNIIPQVTILLDECSKYIKPNRKQAILSFLRRRIDKILDVLESYNITYELSLLENNIIDYAKQNKYIIQNIDVLANILNKSHITIQRSITSLVKKGLLRREGSNKTGYWILNI